MIQVKSVRRGNITWLTKKLNKRIVWGLFYFISVYWSNKISGHRYAYMIWIAIRIEFTTKHIVCVNTFLVAWDQPQHQAQSISESAYVSLPNSPFLSSNLWFPNYPHLNHVCTRGSGNWVMVTTLVCNNGKTAKRGRWFVSVKHSPVHYGV